MRISDWSPDVCSSDLAWPGRAGPRPQRRLERASRVPYRRRCPAHLHDRGKSGELRASRHACGTVRIACRFLANTRKASEALLFGYLLYIAWIALASNEGEAMKAIFIRHGESTGNAGMPCHDLATIEATNRRARLPRACPKPTPQYHVTYTRTRQSAALL